jgi:hypothetical protein
MPVRLIASVALAGVTLLSACGNPQAILVSEAEAQARRAAVEAERARVQAEAQTRQAIQDMSAAVNSATASAQAAVAGADVQLAAIARPGAGGAIDPALVGRWSALGGCSSAVELRADGAFIPPFGGEGRWRKEGNMLAMDLGGSTVRASVRMIDANTMEMIRGELTRGGVAREVTQRC